MGLKRILSEVRDWFLDIDGYRPGLDYNTCKLFEKCDPRYLKWELKTNEFGRIEKATAIDKEGKEYIFKSI